MPWLGEPVIDIVLYTGELEARRAEQLAGGDGALDLLDRGAWVLGVGEVDAVVGEHRVHLVWHRGDEMPEEVCGDPGGCLLVQLDESELGGAIDGYQQVEAPLLGADLGDVDVEVAERVALELTPDGRVAVDVGQLRDAVALQAAMQ